METKKPVKKISEKNKAWREMQESHKKRSNTGYFRTKGFSNELPVDALPKDKIRDIVLRVANTTRQNRRDICHKLYEELTPETWKKYRALEERIINQ